MGQKVSPHGLRVGVIKDWDSKWYADKKNFSNYLVEDHTIREFIKKKLYLAGIAKIIIERAAAGQIRIAVFTAKPGQVIGRSGTGIDDLKAEIKKMTGKEVAIDILEVKRMELDAQLSAESIAQALERRISFRRAMKSAIQRSMKAGAKGIKVMVAGRLGGAEIARSEKYSEGNVPLHTLRADIGYGFAEATTTYGKIGVKVWINHGEILEKGLMPHVIDQGAKEERRPRGDRNDRPRGDRNDRPRSDRGDRPRGDRNDRPRGDRNDRPRGDRPSRDAEAPEAKAVSPRRPRAPRADAPKAEAPKVEDPKVEAPVAETPVAEALQPGDSSDA